MNTTKQQTKIMTLTPILIVLGQVLTLITPSLFGVIRPDFALVFLFLCVMINPTIKQVIMASILTVGLSLLTGANPLFLLPAFIDRLSSAMACLFFYQLFGNRELTKKSTHHALIMLLCTLISGVAYLLSVYFIGTAFGMSELLIIFKMGLPILVLTVGATAVINFFFSQFILKIFGMVKA